MASVDTTREAVLKLLKSGNATVSEAARLAHCDRQLVHYWAKVAGLDVAASRDARLAHLWEKVNE